MTNSPRMILERFSHDGMLRPGLSKEQLALFQAELPGPLPNEIKDLLLYSTGFEYEASRLLGSQRRDVDAIVTIEFRGSGAVGLEFLPFAVDLLGDGSGNFWVVDVNAGGEWGAVIFVCHDPPVIAVQAPNLASFLLQILEPMQTEPREALKYVYDDSVTRIWREDPWLTPALDAQKSTDPILSRFAGQLPENFCLPTYVRWRPAADSVGEKPIRAVKCVAIVRT